MKKYLYIISAAMILFSSCVPKKQLINEQNRVSALQSDSAGTHAKLNDCDAKLNDCDAKLSNCNANLNDSDAKIVALEKEMGDIQDQLQDMSAKYEVAVKNSKMTISEQAKKLKDLQDLIQSEKDIVNKLKKTIANALINFKPDELRVYIKDGNIYVSMQEKLLFKSGSDVVNPEGKKALQKLAGAFNSAPDINIMVEGNTDTVPIHNIFPDNWALSVARATSVTRILTEDYHVDPHRIIAAGRSKFFPVATNDTPEGRAMNRRTDIILSPDLTPLFKLLGQ